MVQITAAWAIFCLITRLAHADAQRCESAGSGTKGDCLKSTPQGTDDFSSLLQHAPKVERAAVSLASQEVQTGQKPSSLATTFIERVEADGGNTGIWVGAAGAAAVIGGGIFFSAGGSKADAEETDVTADRWWLIVMSCMVQLVAGSVYAMGAWQNALRDELGVTMEGIAAVGAATFAGSLAAMLGGQVFDLLGPKAAVTLGATAVTVGYLLIGLAVVAKDAFAPGVKLLLAAVGAMLTGYSSVSLLDNVVCMACSLSFPEDRAAVVGYLKAVLATAAGLWALLWVHVFKAPHGPGLPAYIAFAAAASLSIAIISLPGLKVLPAGSSRKKFDNEDSSRFTILLVSLIALAFFDVGVSFLFSQGKIEPTSMLGYIGSALSVLPLLMLLVARGQQEKLSIESDKKGTVDGLNFMTAAGGLDFWLLWFMQFAVFGGGVATNQNLALILESAGNASASGLGVALFALTSSLSRIAVGILSDRYSDVISRFNWLTIVAGTAVVGQLMVSFMNFGTIMLGTLLMGLSFGAFFTVIVPVVNEMYGRKRFGVIMGSQLASQAAAAFSICLYILPSFYKKAAAAIGKEVCEGPACFRTSFLLLTGVNAVGLAFAFLLQQRNREDMPVDRLKD
eukprot:TRINITY_DN22766_c0_g1_i1.p1 TRINITY_DN22766_c0_g1~~TRINITY_DN22766_c0_g1_i1.p1  ORF type:complete len:623 (-),score=134.13 TRINITY_DN22766_c0_g1_i1:213-2081(-)